MNTLKLIAIAVTAAAVSGPAFAGRDEAQIIAQQRAYDRLVAQGLAGPTGPQGQVGPTSSILGSRNLGHPTERVRR